MDESRQQIIDKIIRAAHERRSEIVTSEVAAEIVEELHELEAFGHEWVSEYLDRLAAKGAAKVYADWRRRLRGPRARTKKGTPVDMPAFAAFRRVADDGSARHVHLPLTAMSLSQVQAKADQVRKQRDTMSVEYRLLADLVEIMQADPSIATAGEAMDRLAA